MSEFSWVSSTPLSLLIIVSLLLTILTTSSLVEKQSKRKLYRKLAKESCNVTLWAGVDCATCVLWLSISMISHCVYSPYVTSVYTESTVECYFPYRVTLNFSKIFVCVLQTRVWTGYLIDKQTGQICFDWPVKLWIWTKTTLTHKTARYFDVFNGSAKSCIADYYDPGLLACSF
jgi:NADH:ubiquinone oxidoreductase subunit 5 (subunit L)/multisubunit Na+/H+ antiporter MnhA subunit